MDHSLMPRPGEWRQPPTNRARTANAGAVSGKPEGKVSASEHRRVSWEVEQHQQRGCGEA